MLLMQLPTQYYTALVKALKTLSVCIYEFITINPTLSSVVQLVEPWQHKLFLFAKTWKRKLRLQLG